MADTPHESHPGIEQEITFAARRIVTDTLSEGFWSEKTRNEIELDFKKAMTSDASGVTAKHLADITSTMLAAKGSSAFLEFQDHDEDEVVPDGRKIYVDLAYHKPDGSTDEVDRVVVLEDIRHKE